MCNIIHILNVSNYYVLNILFHSRGVMVVVEVVVTTTTTTTTIIIIAVVVLRGRLL